MQIPTRLVTSRLLAAGVLAGGLVACGEPGRPGGPMEPNPVELGEGRNDNTVGEDLKEATRDVGDALQDGAIAVEDAIDDASLSAAVRMAFAKDPDLSAVTIGVNAENGLIILTGKVDSFGQKMHAGAVANGVRGVHGVRNELDVSS
jgi:hypothetical protein